MIFKKTLYRIKLSLKLPSNEIEKKLDIIMSVEGQISCSEANQLINLAQNIAKDAVIVEIGTYRGRSTVALAFGSISGNRNRVYAIDPHTEFRGAFGGEFGPQDQAELYQNLVKARVGDMVAVVSLPSVDAAKSWSLRNVGLLWIDGDHSYEAVQADYEAWCNFLVKDGIIAFHDNYAPGVKQLTYKLMEEGKIVPVGQVESLSWFQLVEQ